MTTKQKYGIAILIVVLLLIYFLYYYFVLRHKKEKCPDGRDIPQSGNCADNPIRKDFSGNVIVSQVPQPDSEGCLPASSYTNESFPLSFGMKGENVKQVQMALNRDYGYKISEDGYFGCLTLSAVKKAYGVSTIDLALFTNKISPPIFLP